jgi:hypothetical protein
MTNVIQSKQNLCSALSYGVAVDLTRLTGAKWAGSVDPKLEATVHLRREDGLALTMVLTGNRWTIGWSAGYGVDSLANWVPTGAWPQSIGLAFDRPSSRFAGEIVRRLLPGAEAAQTAAIARRDAAERFDQETGEAIAEVAAALGTTAHGARGDKAMTTFGRTAIEAEASGSNVTLSITNLDPGLAARIIKLIAKADR